MRRCRGGGSGAAGSPGFCVCVVFSPWWLFGAAPGYLCLGGAGEHVKLVPTSVFWCGCWQERP